MDKKEILGMQLLVLLFSVSSLMTKLTANAFRAHGVLSFATLLCFGLACFLMLIYAYYWQILLARVDLSVAYLNKGSMLFWSMLWSALLLHEHVSLKNILGVLLIFAGIAWMNRPQKEEDKPRRGEDGTLPRNAERGA